MEKKSARRGGGRDGGVALPLPPPPGLSASSSSSIPAARPPKANAGGGGDCSTPRSLLSRILQRGDGTGGFGCRVRLPRYCSSGGGKPEKKMKENVQELAAAAAAASSAAEVKVVERAEVDEPPRSSSGKKPEDLSMNLGLGVSLVFLLSKGATELSKMQQLRAQMEALLLDIKAELQTRKNSQPSSTQSKSSSTISKNPIAGADADAVSDCSRTVDGDRCGVVMEQLEAELEVELKRLQSSGNSKNQILFIDERGHETNRKSGISESRSASCVDDDGVKDDEVTEGAHEDEGEEEEKEGEGRSPPHGGVSARELERRLHELLRTRQQERIAELESALEFAEQSLHEKESEICWWRDTAKLVAQHKDESVFR